MSDEVRKKIRLGTTGVVADSGLVNNANMAEHEAHVCICYKAQECMLKASEIKMSVDEVLALAKTIIKIQIMLPPPEQRRSHAIDANGKTPKIAKLFNEDFWVTR